MAVVASGLEYYGPSRTLMGMERRHPAGLSLLLDLLPLDRGQPHRRRADHAHQAAGGHRRPSTRSAGITPGSRRSSGSCRVTQPPEPRPDMTS
ncbi:MAG: hypothetical protein R3A10_18505 [Caldilineaceae bacterium]